VSEPDTGIENVAAAFASIVDNIEHAVRGKRDAVELVVTAMLAGGHVLVEDLPGVGKTLVARALAASVHGSWARVQFTPDLLPSDLLGVSVWSDNGSGLDFRPGPVFRHLVLGDEINRASPKTQSALLEAMEEQQVSVDGITHPLPSPFLVIATQNPADLAGTYPLPENQLDRFMVRVHLGYPDSETEIDIIDRHLDGSIIEDLQPVCEVQQVLDLRRSVSSVYVAPALKVYVVELAEASRRHPSLAVGISPRASIAIVRAARVRAASRNRSHVVPDDVQWLLRPVLAHRLTVTPDAELAGTSTLDVLEDIVSQVPVPTARRRSGV